MPQKNGEGIRGVGTIGLAAYWPANRMTPTLPTESFTELAIELAIIARDKATAAEASELMVASIETKGERETGAQIRHNGMRSSVAMLKRRAILAGRAADVMLVLATREREIREMMAGQASFAV